ncbi:hypothetical protein ABZ330_21895 [Streptomyces sp. NPDC006172]|uniref:hypothetical protein n=1 Tax=Streptomyces sp. NPDC006172 TaxID=3154470 RepID=UPI0033DB627A
MCTICDAPIAAGEPHRRVIRRGPDGSRRPAAYTHDVCRSAPKVVPFITKRESERVPSPTIANRVVGGIGYVGEVPSDRDRGVLWRRSVNARDRSRPLYSEIHPGRQCLAMRHELCQVCGEPADRDERGVLWLIEEDRDAWVGWPTELVTTHPPICRPCLQVARSQCPHLWAGTVAVRVGRSEVSGVYGQRYTQGPFGPRPLSMDVVEFASPLIRWTVAAQLVRTLYDCKIVRVAEELATLP